MVADPVKERIALTKKVNLSRDNPFSKTYQKIWGQGVHVLDAVKLYNQFH